MKVFALLSLLGLFACGCDTTTPTTPQVDNTAINERDRLEPNKTPFDQNENQKDIDITAEIRKQVIDGEMSVYAQNVKIMTQDGNVTLRGPVATDEEKMKIESIARNVAGETNVDSHLEVSKSS